jgi:hypothetical protein
MYQNLNEHSDELIYIISIKLNNDDAQRATYGTPSLATRNQIVMEFLEKNPGIELTTFSLCKNCFEKQFAKPTTGYYH